MVGSQSETHAGWKGERDCSKTRALQTVVERYATGGGGEIISGSAGVYDG